MGIIKRFDEFLDESHWSEMNRRSQGIKVRKEDDIDNLDLDEFVQYLKDTYTVDDDTNFFAIGTFPTWGTDIVNISIPIEKKDIYVESRYRNRMLSIGKDTKTNKFVDIRPNKYVFYLYPRELGSVFGDKFEVDHTNFELKPKDGVITNTLCVEVIDKLLGMVERPIMTKNK